MRCVSQQSGTWFNNHGLRFLLGKGCVTCPWSARTSRPPPRANQWNKLRWYPQQPQRFDFTNLSEACCEAKSWNLLRNPVEPDLAAPKPPRAWNLLRNPVWEALVQIQARFNRVPEKLPEKVPGGFLVQTDPCWTWPGSAPKPPRPSPEPPPEPCWTWPGSAPKPPPAEPSEPSPEPRWIWPGACTSSHRSFSGLRTPLACAVGEKKHIFDNTLGYTFSKVWNLSSLGSGLL